MAYTPNTWVVGDVITAEKLNALEQAVAENSQKSGGGVDAIVYFPNSTIGWAVEGDFNAAKAKLAEGRPIYAFYYNYMNIATGHVYLEEKREFANILYDANADTIALRISSSEGFNWTADGIEYYD